MEQRAIKALLEQVAAGQVDVNDALLKLKIEPFEELGFAKLDSHIRACPYPFPDTPSPSGRCLQAVFGTLLPRLQSGSCLLP